MTDYLYISEPEPRDSGPILVCDAEHNDVAEFFHEEHATVPISYETALELARILVRDRAADIDSNKCDVRCCVNPEHLFLGTHLDNMRDRHLKGRSTGPKGSAAAKAKLSDADVVLIRSSKLPARELAESLGVNKSTIYSILNGRTWVHV